MKLLRLPLVLFVLLLTLAVSQNAHARIAHAWFTADGLAPLKDDGGYKLRLFHAGVSGGAPLILEQPDFLTLSIGYEALMRKIVAPSEIEFDGRGIERAKFLEDNHLEDTLHGFKLGFFYRRTLTAKWKLYGSVSARHHGDLTDVDWYEIQPFGFIGAGVQLHPTFELTFSLAYLESLRPVHAAPGIGWRWEPAPYFRSVAQLPVFARFVFTMYDDSIEMGAVATLKGADYFVQENDLGIEHFDHFSVRAGGVIGWRIWRDLWISAYAGAVPYWFFRGEDGQGREVYEGDYEATWYGRIVLELRRFPKKKGSVGR